MDPLFKWPGGKTGELTNIRPLIPEHERFIEPFAGGAAVFFDLEPEKAVINDINETLTSAYKMIGNEPNSIENEMRCISGARKQVALFAESAGPTVLEDYRGASDKEEILQVVEDALSLKHLFLSYAQDDWGDPDQLFEQILLSLSNKLKRTFNHEQKEAWPDEDVMKQIETSFHAGLYTYIRDFHDLKSPAVNVGRFLYLREFCYGGMFRYNKHGKFNIPYGGHSYNKKSLTSKINYWFSDDVRNLLARTTIHCGSFEELASKVDFKTDDFVFLDPPYDTEFSDYDQFTFDARKQTELAQWFAELKSPALMIIGKTPMVLRLYEDARKSNRSIEIDEYEKTYMYNVRGRNERKITHLAIRNYPIPV